MQRRKRIAVDNLEFQNDQQVVWRLSLSCAVSEDASGLSQSSMLEIKGARSPGKFSTGSDDTPSSPPSLIPVVETAVPVKVFTSPGGSMSSKATRSTTSTTNGMTMRFGVILAYMCVKLQMRLYVCHRVGPFWVHFGSTWGPFWVHFGSILGPFWVHSGSILGPFWFTISILEKNVLKTRTSV